MFTITQDQDIIRMHSTTSVLEILPGCGAILNSWQVRVGRNQYQVIDGYEGPEDFKNNCESKGFRSCKLSPYVCRTAHEGQYAFQGQDYKVGKFILNGSALHGLLYDMPFEMVFSESDEGHALVALHHAYKGTDPGYPFPYFMEVVYLLLPDNELKIITKVFNQHNQPIPIADGWHPYFSLGRPIDELFLEIATDQMVAFNEALIPTGELKPENRFEFLNSLEDIELDNCFLLRKPLLGPACSLVNTEDKLALTITPDENYPYLQIYTPPHRQSIAIENLSATPDALNNRMGLIILEPEEQASFTTTYQVREWN